MHLYGAVYFLSKHCATDNKKNYGKPYTNSIILFRGRYRFREISDRYISYTLYFILNTYIPCRPNKSHHKKRLYFLPNMFGVSQI